MKQVGTRREPPVTEQSDGLLLAEGARFNEAVSRLAQTTFIPKGIYRYKSHTDANRHAQDCLVRGMGLLAAKRS